MKILIVCPTITHREESFKRLVQSYEKTIPSSVDVDFVAPQNCKTVGEGWVLGAESCLRTGWSPDFIHLSNDDIQAMPGWFETAVETVQQDAQPAPYLDTFGEITYGHPPTLDMSDWKITTTGVIPFMSRHMYECLRPVFPLLRRLHYASDDLVSYVLRQNGVATIARKGYHFKHYHEAHGRGAGMTQDQRMTHDLGLFHHWVQTGEM